MKPNNLLTPLSPSINKLPSGFVLIVVVLLIGAVLSVILIQTALGALTGLEQSRLAFEGAKAQIHTNNCAHEALVRLSRDSSYAGGTFFLGAGNCAVTVNGSENSRTLAVEGTLGNFTQRLSIALTLGPISIVSWE